VCLPGISFGKPDTKRGFDLNEKSLLLHETTGHLNKNWTSVNKVDIYTACLGVLFSFRALLGCLCVKA
jgi:hypothetical protein